MSMVHFLSDLHLENETHSMKEHRAPADTDVVVLAGDTHPGVAGVMWASEHFPGLPVIYVPGNHEYYGKRGFHRHKERMRDKAVSLGGHVLVSDRATHVLSDTRFICATLWTDYRLQGDQDTGIRNADVMNDYRMISSDTGRLLSPYTLLNEHEESVRYIRDELARPFDGPTLVVTHHAPSALSLHAHGLSRQSEASQCYASDLDDLLLEGRPDAWIHGHLHANQDYMIGDTCILSNPRGWMPSHSNRNFKETRGNPGFRPELLLDTTALVRPVVACSEP